MNVQQLRDYLDRLLIAGVDPRTPVCIPTDEEAYEVDDCKIINGPFREDPSPKMPAFLNSNGSFVLLQTSDDYEWLAPDRYREVEGPDAPNKEWREGEEWWLKDRRQNRT